jgi:hypothetical protein
MAAVSGAARQSRHERQERLSRQWRPRHRASSAALACALSFLAISSAVAQAPSEYQVKAAYLYGFGRFVAWPAPGPSNDGTSFSICVLGDDPFGRLLDDVAAGGVLTGKPVRVVRLASDAPVLGCQMLFVSASEERRIDRVLGTIGALPVLTVSDAPRFAQRGGMIGFTLDNNRVRFVVNLEATQRAGLTLDSELLRVAVAIIRERSQG